MVQLSPSFSSCRLDDTCHKSVSGHLLGSDQSRAYLFDCQERCRSGVEKKAFLESSQVEDHSGRIASEDVWFHDSVSDKMHMQKQPDQKAMERGGSFAEVSRRETGAGVQASKWAHAERLQMVGAVDKAEKEGGFHSVEDSSRRPHWDFSGLPYSLTGNKRGMTVRELEHIQSIGQAVIGTDLAGYITSWNKAAENTYKWKAEEVVGRNLGQVLTPRDLQKNSLEVLGKGSHGELWSGPYPALRKDGVVINTGVTETPMVDQHNKILGIVKISVDLDSLPQVSRTDGRNAHRRSFSDADRINEIELDRVPQTGSDDGRILLGWQRVFLEDESHSEESLPDAKSSSAGVSSYLRVGRSSVQNLLRKLQIGAGQRSHGTYDVSHPSSDRVNNEMLFRDRSNPSSAGSIDHSQSFPAYGSLEHNVEGVEGYDSIKSLMGPEVRPARGEAESSAEGLRSQNEFSKDVMVKSISVPHISTSNYALSRSSSGSAPSSATALDAMGSPFDRTGADNSRTTVESSLNFVQAEEDFQLQIAVALRVAAEAAAVDDPNLSANIWGPQGDIKLNPTCSKTEATAYRYWVSTCLGYEDRIEDGFYEVWGMSPYIWSMCTDSNELGRMPPLESLRVVPVNDDGSLEVLLVDRNMDPTLRELEEKAVCLAYKSEDVLEMASELSRIVSEVMGGSARSDDDLRQSWQEASSKLMQLLSTIVLPIGVLRVGLTRHRALLFKFMADSIGLACRIVRGSAFSGKDDDFASVVVKSDDNREWIVDLLVRPGTRSLPDKRLAALPTVIPTPLQFERLNPFAGSSVSVHNWTRGLEGESSKQQYSPEPFLDTGSPINILGSKATSSIPQGLDFSLSEAPKVESVSAKGSIEDGSKGKYGFVDLLDRPELRNLVDPVIQISEADKRNSFLEDPLKLLDRRDNQKVGSGRDSKASVSSAEDGGRGYDGGWAKKGRQPTGSDDSMKGVAGMVIEQIISQVNDFEIAWEDIVLGERIGQGSFGKVYRGDWQGSDVAVKVFLDQDLRAEALDEFKSEMALMRRLRHPNIVLFMGAVSKPPNLSLITEFCPRGSLYRLLHRPNRELDDRRRIRMAIDVAKGMNYLHRCSPPVVHRDLKSPNLLVDKNWTVKVCDFGLSRQKHGTFLSSKSSAGTPEWMAPEVLRNEPSDEKSDVYSFGVILWELCTLQVPWNGMNPIQVVGAVGFQHRRLSIPDFVDESMAALIDACWRTDTKRRPSFADLMQELKNLQLRAVPGQPSPDQKDE